MPKHVISFIDWYTPAYKAGGPVRSMSNLVQLLQGHVDFTLICGIQEIDGESLSKNPKEIYSGKFGEKIIYQNSPTKKLIKECIQSNTVFHLNGIYSLKFSILPLLLLRLFFRKQAFIISPRGMLNPGALKIKRTKKLLFIKLLSWSGLTQKARWHATSEQEKQAILKYFPNSKSISVLSNVPIAPEKIVSKEPKVQGQLEMFSTTRVVPIKRLETILEALLQFPVSGKLSWDVFGPIEDESYALKLKTLASRIPNLEMNFKGSLNPEDLSKAISRYHLFCLPSDNENFGHAIYESFAMGVPVLISDQTPWHHLQEKKAGFDLPHSKLQDYAHAIQFFTDMNQNDWQVWSEASLKFAYANYAKEDWIKGYLTLFNFIF